MVQLNGIAGMGNITSMTNYNKLEPYVVGWRWRLKWSDIEVTPGVYDWTSFEADVDIVVADDKYVFVEVFIANTDLSASPSWLFSVPYSVPIVTVPGGQRFPYYLNSTFETRKNLLFQSLRERIRDTWSTARKNKLIFWQSAEEKTGDEGSGIETVSSVTINGVVQPNPNTYAISSDAWTTYKKNTAWPVFVSGILSDISFCYPAFNPSNEGTNWAYLLDTYTNACLKVGQVTHSYNAVGEFFYAQRCNLVTSVIPSNMLYGEFENTNDTAWFQISTRQNTLALILSGITHGNTLMSIAYATFNEVINVNSAGDFWMFQFANDFLGLRDASTSDKAFIALRDCLDGADVARFPETTYGSLIPTSQQAAYNVRYNAIVNSSDPQELKNSNLASLLSIYFNDTRRVNIDNAFPNLTFQTLDTSLDHDAYHQDGGVYMLGNYKKFINQYDPYNTCTGYARIGATSQPHGRFCCGTSTEMYFYFDAGIVDNNSFVVTFKIWYYDEGSRQWSLNYWNGTSKTNAGTVTNTNTNTWIEKTYTLNNFHGGGNINFGNDFSIKSEDGSITKIEIIRFDRISQNTVGTSGVYILGNNSGTICGGSQVTLYTNGSFAVGKTLYSDVDLTTIVTGSTFVLNTSNNTIYALDTSTGVIGASTGLTCSGSPVSGTYILGNTLSSICSNGSATYYTDGAFAISSTLYTDNTLITPVTTFSYVVRVATNIIYNIDSGTGVIGTATSSICNGGTLTVAQLGNDINTVCEQGETNVYTDGKPDIGSIVYTDINLTTILVGYTLGVRVSNGRIFLLNSSTGEILSSVGMCGTGIPVVALLGNAFPDICGTTPTTIYVIGNLKTGVFLYQDINITTPVTGYLFASAGGFVYNIDSSTGEVLSVSGEACLTGLPTVCILGNDINVICNQDKVTVYTETDFKTGAVVYSDINLINIQTGFQFIVNAATGKVFLIDTDTGIIGNQLAVKCESSSNGNEDVDLTIYKFNSNNDIYQRVIMSVIIDVYNTYTGWEIAAKLKEIIGNLTNRNLVYTITNSNGSIAGYFIANVVNSNVANIQSYLLKRPFKNQETEIVKEINTFLASGEWQIDYLH